MLHERMVRIVVADDHPIFRDGVKRLLESEPGFRVVGEASDGGEAIQITRQLQPDVLLLDLTMPGVPGLEALKALASADCAVRPIVLTAGLDKDGLVAALQLGARGIVLKESATKMLFQSIRCVMANQYWLGRENIADVVDALKRLSAQIEDQTKRRQFGLTRRELQVVAGAAAGESNREIAARLRVSEETVKHHLSNIFDKLGVFSRVELAVFAVNHGLVADNASVC